MNNEQQHVADRLARLDRLTRSYEKKLVKALLTDLEPCIESFALTGNVALSAAVLSTSSLGIALEDLYLTIIQQEAKIEYLYQLSTQKALPILPVNEWLRLAKNFIAVKSSKAIIAITNTTRKQVRQVLSDSLDRGTGIQGTARNLRSRIISFSRSRAKVISRTELIGAQNYGSYCGAATSGLKLDKVWLTTSDKRTRFSHIQAGGQRVDINAPFIVGGEICQFPGDPDLSGSERCNCRCTQIYRAKPAAVQGALDF